MTVLALRRFPVKSFQGEPVDRVDVDASGLALDRRWGVWDATAGKVLSAKREGRLLDATATTTADGGVTVTLPGRDPLAPGPELDDALRAWLGRDDVSLRASTDVGGASYEMHISSVNEDSRLMEIPCPPGTFLDFAAVHVLTTASLRAIAPAHPGGDWDVARFRPSILLELDGDGFVEDAWVGKRVRIGGVVLEPFMPTIRCAMTTRAQRGLPRDIDVAKTVNRVNKGNLGIYASVVEPGTVAIGDDVTVEG